MFEHRVKRGVIVILVFLLSILTIRPIHAFGISIPYLENDTLKVDAGKDYTYTLTIQNTDNISYYVDIIYSSTDTIASLRNSSYYLLNKTYNNTFYFDLSVPSTAKIGDKYILDYSVRPRINDSSTLSGLEIKRNIKILVINDGTRAETSKRNITQENIIQLLKEIGTYMLAVIIIVLVLLIGIRIWRLSKGLSLRVSNERLTNYTISQAMNLDEVKALLKKMSDEEFELPEIKNIYKEKISELTTHNLTHEINIMSRRDVIKTIDKIKQEKNI